MGNHESEKAFIQKRTASFSYALNGIKFLLKNEPNSRIHLFFSFLAIALGVFFKIQFMEWIIIVFCISIVFAAELFNTAIEKTIDLISPEKNKTAGIVKDTAAGAVLVVAMGTLIAGILVFYPYLYQYAH